MNDVEFGPYVPHNAFLLTATWAVAQKVANTPGVAWVGVWRREFKMNVVEEGEDVEEFEQGSLMVALAPGRRWTPLEGN